MEKLKRTKELFGQGSLNINEHFIKDGFIYLLRGDKPGLEKGFSSYYYRNGETLETMGISAYDMARIHVLNGNTAFLSLTTAAMVAAAFSNRGRIYVVKLPLQDIYKYEDDTTEALVEDEYLIPDYISGEEVLISFRYNKVKQIYNYLTGVLQLPVTPEDLGFSEGNLEHFDQEQLEQIEQFINGASFLDAALEEYQRASINALRKK